MSHPQKSDTLASIQELNAALQNLTVESPRLGFLSLSGEIRNKIYSYLANERINHDAPVNSEATSFFSTPNYLRTPAHQIVLCYENKDDVLYEPPEWNTIQRYDMGLTQACHQIREEYEATYRQNHSMSISLDALVTSTAFLDPDQPPILPLGSVRITVRESSWSTPNIDILPFLKAYKNFPSLKLHFELPEHARTAFGDVFSVRKNNKWWVGVEEHVAFIHVWPEVYGERAKVGITVTKEFEMKWRRGRGGVQKVVLLAAWLREMGLEALSRWPGLRIYVV
ncbi:hypothetical protein J4E85_006721 [Alternaria conjuncta]|uniref:uncharacterized protein n=1 Tax=Alternaria conjuncta TaxID=181017 RepID=UPI00222083F2|nr:uncharacterized protein J4E85_006721 [Alternaria conjuncta]KAI4926428.1 hypothetical protein J4E85_006721 [Alternaria conjuncta]